MNTTNNSSPSIGKKVGLIGEFLEGVGKLFTGIKGFIVGAVALAGTITTISIVHPDPVKPEPVPVVNISGKWIDPQDNYILFQQQGKSLTYQSYDASETVTGRGTGKIVDRMVQLRGVVSAQGQTIRYTGQFTLADGDDELTGSLTPNDVLVNLVSIFLFGSGETTLTKE